MGWLSCDAIAAIIMYLEDEPQIYKSMLNAPTREVEDDASQIECTRMRMR